MRHNWERRCALQGCYLPCKDSLWRLCNFEGSVYFLNANACTQHKKPDRRSTVNSVLHLCSAATQNPSQKTTTASPFCAHSVYYLNFLLPFLLSFRKWQLFLILQCTLENFLFVYTLSCFTHSNVRSIKYRHGGSSGLDFNINAIIIQPWNFGYFTSLFGSSLICKTRTIIVNYSWGY